VKTGIQEIQEVLDSRLRGSDDCGDFPVDISFVSPLIAEKLHTKPLFCASLWRILEEIKDIWMVLKG
jgi:hypothetical protein